MFLVVALSKRVALRSGSGACQTGTECRARERRKGRKEDLYMIHMNRIGSGLCNESSNHGASPVGKTAARKGPMQPRRQMIDRDRDGGWWLGSIWYGSTQSIAPSSNGGTSSTGVLIKNGLARSRKKTDTRTNRSGVETQWAAKGNNNTLTHRVEKGGILDL